VVATAALERRGLAVGDIEFAAPRAAVELPQVHHTGALRMRALYSIHI
jgi:hypothetical protein